MKYHTIFEVKKPDGLFACIPLDYVVLIQDSPLNAVVSTSGGDDVESSESYTELKNRLEEFLRDNLVHEEKQYEEREKVAHRIEDSLDRGFSRCLDS